MKNNRAPCVLVLDVQSDGRLLMDVPHDMDLRRRRDNVRVELCPVAERRLLRLFTVVQLVALVLLLSSPGGESRAAQSSAAAGNFLAFAPPSPPS